jgi:DNA-directed RNA polymerase specialized sigma24 family protein
MVSPVGNPDLSDRRMAGDETLLRLIAQRDPDAAAGFFDAHAPSVRRYCEEVAAPARLDEATLAAFVDLLARVESAPPGAELEELLIKATRNAAASRADVTGARGPECHAMPDLLAALINGELERDPHLLDEHRARCRVCKRTEERFAVADEGWSRPAAQEPAAEVRVAWLELMAERSEEPTPPQSVVETASVAPQPIRGTRRQGGLVGAARRFASPGRRDQ